MKSTRLCDEDSGRKTSDARDQRKTETDAISLGLIRGTFLFGTKTIMDRKENTQAEFACTMPAERKSLSEETLSLEEQQKRNSTFVV